MERVMSVEDKIRKAEEIYYRRKNQEIPDRETTKTSKPKKNIKLFKKMFKQIIICLLIYSVCYLIINNNYIFSEDFTNKAKEILSQDINLPEIYNIILNKFETFRQENIETPETTNEAIEEVKVEEEKSPQKICSKQGWVKRVDVPVVCLPNSVYVIIEDVNKVDFDITLE